MAATRERERDFACPILAAFCSSFELAGWCNRGVSIGLMIYEREREREREREIGREE